MEHTFVHGHVLYHDHECYVQEPLRRYPEHRPCSGRCHCESQMEDVQWAYITKMVSTTKLLIKIETSDAHGLPPVDIARRIRGGLEEDMDWSRSWSKAARPL